MKCDIKGDVNVEKSESRPKSNGIARLSKRSSTIDAAEVLKNKDQEKKAKEFREMSPRSRFSRTLMNKVISLTQQLGGEDVAGECNRMDD